MDEKVLNKSKNGLPMLLLFLLLYAAAIAAFIVGNIIGDSGTRTPLTIALFVGGLVYALLG